jgi:hypothetical protein
VIKKVSKRNTSIIIKGKHYDALTGDLLVAIKNPPKPVVAKSIDGVRGGASKQPVVVALAVPKAPSVSLHARQPAAHGKPHHTKPSATLMRHAVTKPSVSSVKRRSKVQAAASSASHPAVIVHHPLVTKTAIHAVNHPRLARAQQVSTSDKIAHFAHEIAQATPIFIEETTAAIDKAIVIPQTSMPNRVYRPDVAPGRSRQATTSDVFEQALLRATSHEQPAPAETARSKRLRRKAARSLRQRMVRFSVGAVAVLALVGFFGFQNADTLQFKTAANKSGFAVTMPGYQPAGFKVAAIHSYSGYLDVDYASNTSYGNRNFKLTERPSTWDNKTLLNNLITGGNTTLYATLEKSGRTVYVYGRNQAAWVNNGVLYQLHGNGSLGTNEFGEIAASM